MVILCVGLDVNSHLGKFLLSTAFHLLIFLLLFIVLWLLVPTILGGKNSNNSCQAVQYFVLNKPKGGIGDGEEYKSKTSDSTVMLHNYFMLGVHISTQLRAKREIQLDSTHAVLDKDAY